MLHQDRWRRNTCNGHDTPEKMSTAISSLESLNGLIAFASAVETGSFSSAARHLGLSGSAIGKAIDRLEQRLGVRLLNRTTRSLALTDEGEVLYRHVTQVLSSLHDAEQELRLRESTPRGRLKISVPTVIGRRFVLPALRDFHSAYPQVIVNISLDAHRVDLIEEGYDLALWPGELEDSSLQTRCLGPHVLITCASPAYLDQHGTPTSPADLAYHCCIHYRLAHDGRIASWAFKDAVAAKPIIPAVVLNDTEALAAAALAGLGIVQVPDYLVREDIAAGRLQAVLERHAIAHGGIHLVWPAMSAQAPRVRAFIDFITARLVAQLYPASTSGNEQGRP